MVEESEFCGICGKELTEEFNNQYDELADNFAEPCYCLLITYIFDLKKEIVQLKEQLQVEIDYAKDQQKIFQKEYYPPKKAYNEGYNDARENFER